MDHSVGDPWEPVYCSSSSSENEHTLVNALVAIEEEEEAIIQAIGSNNMMIARNVYHQNEQVIHGGSIPGHIIINRDCEAADRNLFEDYFAENPTYNDAMFRRRFRMSRVCSFVFLMLSKLMTITSHNKVMHFVNYRKQ